MMNTCVLQCTYCEGSIIDKDDFLQCDRCGFKYSKFNGIVDFIDSDQSSTIPSYVEKLFKWISPIYQSFYFPFLYRLGALPDKHSPAEETKEIVRKTQNSGVALDVACGTGLLTRELARANQIVYGLDLSRPMLREAIENTPDCPTKDIHYVRGNAQYLPVQNNTIDVLTCSGAIYFFPDVMNVLNECIRVLKTGGSFGGMTLVYRGILNNAITRSTINFYEKFSVYNIYEVEEFLRLLKDSGFQDIRYSIYGCICIFNAKNSP